MDNNLDVQELNDSRYDLRSDEIEEKAEAIEMLSVLIEECGGGFAEYIKPT